MSALGEVVLEFDVVPLGRIWTGTVAVPNADPSAVFVAQVGGSGTGSIIGTWAGPAPFGPLQLAGYEVLTITGFNLTPAPVANARVPVTTGAIQGIENAVWLGSDDAEGDEPIAWPMPGGAVSRTRNAPGTTFTEANFGASGGHNNTTLLLPENPKRIEFSIFVTPTSVFSGAGGLAGGLVIGYGVPITGAPSPAVCELIAGGLFSNTSYTGVVGASISPGVGGSATGLEIFVVEYALP